MKEFNAALDRNHPDDDTVVRSAMLLVGGRGWIVQYDVGAEMEPWLMNVVADVVKWAHPVDYDVTRAGMMLGPQPLGDILGATENVGSCEPSPRINWDKTGTTWHTETKAGRYSVRRLGKRQPFGAFLNGARISNIPESTSLDVVKRDVERRIIEARRIANMNQGDARKALLG